jgi:hypothetical protein
MRGADGNARPLSSAFRRCENHAHAREHDEKKTPAGDEPTGARGNRRGEQKENPRQNH